MLDAKKSKLSSNLKIALLIVIIIIGCIILYFRIIQKPVHKIISRQDISKIQAYGISGTKNIEDDALINNIIMWFNQADDVRLNEDFAGTTPESGVIINLKLGKRILVLNSGSDFEIQRDDIGLKNISYWAKQRDLKEYLERLNNLEEKNKDAIAENNQEAASEYPINMLKSADIDWITKQGGLPSDKVWVLLCPNKDDDKIHKIINLVKAYSNIHKSTKEDLDFLNQKHGYPVDIVIKMKNGSKFTLMSAMKITTTSNEKGVEKTGTRYKDHYLLEYENEGKEEYYTIYSEDATAYVLENSEADFPRVDNEE